MNENESNENAPLADNQRRDHMMPLFINDFSRFAGEVRANLGLFNFGWCKKTSIWSELCSFQSRDKVACIAGGIRTSLGSPSPP